MNRIERFIYDLVKNNSFLKNLIRDSYQTVLSIIPQRKVKSKYRIIERPGYFFGFHDKNPWSYDNKMLLAHKFNIPNRDINKNDSIEVGYFHGEDYKEFKSLANTTSWNWQQGSMLQWLNEENEIIYNDWDGNNNVAMIINTDGELINKINRPIGSISSNGKFATSYSFERLNIGMFGYGYPNENDINKQELVPKSSGMELVDLETGDSKTLFSVHDIATYHQDELMNNAYHFFTHSLFAPGGKRFLFLHRWYREGRQLCSRMISCDVDGGNMHIFPTDNMVSHITWISENEVFAYCNTNKYGDGYHIFKDMSGQYRKVGSIHYTSDGHPQYNFEKNLIVTDTYPNRFRIQEISIYDIENDKKEVIARLWSPKQFKDSVRCDLHPRWDRLGEAICFDSAHLGTRALCTLKLLSK